MPAFEPYNVVAEDNPWKVLVYFYCDHFDYVPNIPFSRFGGTEVSEARFKYRSSS
jgi:hypothetical protein